MEVGSKGNAQILISFLSLWHKERRTSDKNHVKCVWKQKNTYISLSLSFIYIQHIGHSYNQFGSDNTYMNNQLYNTEYSVLYSSVFTVFNILMSRC